MAPVLGLEQSAAAIATVSCDTSQHQHVLFAKAMRAGAGGVSGAGEKQAISARSHANEAAVYSSTTLLSRLKAAGGRTPKPLAIVKRSAPGKKLTIMLPSGDTTRTSDCANSEHPHTFTYFFLLEAMAPPRFVAPERFRSLAATSSALAALAALHAASWDALQEGGDLASLTPVVFSVGCWWRRPLRPTVRFDTVSEVLKELAVLIPPTAGLEEERVRRVGDWLLAAAPARAAARAARPSRCLLHGDAKAVNFLFDQESAHLPVLVDWQWAGCGASGAADVAYCIAGSVEPALLKIPGAEEALLRGYYDELAQRVAAVQRAGGASPAAGGLRYSLDELRADYEEEFLEHAVTALPYLLAGISPEVMAENRRKYGFLTYEQDVDGLAWLLVRAVEIAQRLEAAGT